MQVMDAAQAAFRNGPEGWQGPCGPANHLWSSRLGCSVIMYRRVLRARRPHENRTNSVLRRSLIPDADVVVESLQHQFHLLTFVLSKLDVEVPELRC